MGWTYRYDDTKKKLIAYLTQELLYCIDDSSVPKGYRIDPNKRGEIIDSHIHGNNLWKVVSIQTRLSETSSWCEVDRYIALDLLGKDRMGNWGYKGMCESMGPYEFSCPVRFLDMVPVPKQVYSDGERDNEWAVAWREKVREQATKH